MKQQTPAAPNPAVPPAQTENSPNHPLPIKKLLALAALVLIVVLAGVLAYRHNQRKQAEERAYRADKVRFAEVDKDVQAARQRVIQALGKPDAQDYGKSCAHTNQKYSDGTLYCSVHFTVTYEVNAQQEFNVESKELARVINRKQFNFDQASYERYSLDLDNNVGLARLQLQDDNSMTCDLRSEYADSLNVNDSAALEKPHTANFNLKCISNVVKPIYPLAE